MVLCDSINGFNPLNWNCEKDGCFNIKRRPKIQYFCDCFPGRINFGDLDGIVEINGYALLIEWKTSCEGDISEGQKKMYHRLTKKNTFIVYVIIGNAETMVCTKHRIFWNGKDKGWKDSSLNILKDNFKRWCKWAYAQK